LSFARCAMSAASNSAAAALRPASESAAAAPRSIPLEARSSCIAAIRCSRWPRLVMPTCQHPSFRRHSSVHVFRAHTPILFRMHTPVFLSTRLPAFGSSSSHPSPFLPYTIVPQMHACDCSMPCDRHAAIVHNLYGSWQRCGAAMGSDAAMRRGCPPTPPSCPVAHCPGRSCSIRALLTQPRCGSWSLLSSDGKRTVAALLQLPHTSPCAHSLL
jgi:hypothetical protein